jgi:hypothetical protein
MKVVSRKDSKRLNTGTCLAELQMAPSRSALPVKAVHAIILSSLEQPRSLKHRTKVKRKKRRKYPVPIDSDITPHARLRILLYRYRHMSKVIYVYFKDISVSISFSKDQCVRVKTVAGSASRIKAN